jgi:hypothetical protein
MPSLLFYLLVMVASGRGDNDLQVPPVTEASCLIAEHCWDRVRWALEEHAWRFERVGVPGTTRRR